MNDFNEECKRDITVFFEKLTQLRHRLPSEDAIYSMLETYAFPHDVIGNSVEEIQSSVINYALEKSKGKPGVSRRAIRDNVNIPNNFATTPGAKNIPVSYQTVGVYEHKFKNVEYDDMIWLHFSLMPEKLEAAGKALVDILTENNINYNIKMPNVVGPDAILVGLFSKEQAKLVIEKCSANETIKDAILLNNPFMAHQEWIGVAKETMKRNYTRHISSLILDYARNCDKPKLTFNGFCRHVLKLFNEDNLKRTYQERLLDYYTVLGLYCIDQNKEYLDELQHHQRVIYDREFFEGHRIVYENGSYRYTTKDEQHIEQDNFNEWMKLQAYHCMQRMFFEQYGEMPKENFELNEGMVAQISSMIDAIMRGESFYNTSKYNDLMINELYPYLVGYYASEAKLTTPEEVKYIIERVSARMVTKLKLDGVNKNFYQIGEQTIQSTIPPIRFDNVIVGIEYLDYELNYCNVFVYKNDKIKGHLGIFLDVDKSKIWEDGETEASMYRVAVAHSLGHFDLLEKEPVTRGVHEGLLVHLDGDAAVKEDTSENVSSITL